MITVDTGLIPLLGNPLRQSFAARLHNEAYRSLGLDLLYFPIEVGNEHLGDVVGALRHMNSPGFAVTKPNKIKVIEYLDELDDLAGKMGAVNTVVKRDGRLIGYNTDGEGFVRSFLDETRINLSDTTFFCFGAGGAARAICCCLAYHGAKHIIVTNRTDAKAKSLAEDINSVFAPVAQWIPFSEKQRIEAEIMATDVIMNNSGVGMYPNTNETPIDKNLLHEGQICFDATYNPLKTIFLQEAEQMGCQIVNGQGMSIYQGAIQVKLWTGKDEPIASIRETNNKIVAEMMSL